MSTRLQIGHKERIGSTTITYRVDINDDNYSGSIQEKVAGGNFFNWEYESIDERDPFESPVQKSTFTCELIVQNDTDFAIFTDILDADEDRFSIDFYIDGDHKWSGKVLNDLVEYQPDGTYPFTVDIKAKDLSTLAGDTPDLGLISSRTRLSEVIATCLQGTGFSLPIRSYTNVTNETELDQSNDFLYEIWHENRAFFDNGQAMNSLEVLEMICRAYNLILRQSDARWVIEQLPAVAKGDDIQFDYDSDGLNPVSSTPDRTVTIDQLDKFLLPGSTFKLTSALKSITSSYNHKTQILNLPTDTVNYTSDPSLSEIEEFSLSFDNVGAFRFAGVFDVEAELSGSNPAGSIIEAYIRVRGAIDGQADTYLDNSGDWSTGEKEVSITLSGSGTTVTGNFDMEESDALPSVVHSLHIEFLFAEMVDDVGTGVTVEETHYTNINTYIFQIVQSIKDEGATINHRYTRQGNYSVNEEIPETVIGSGPTPRSVGSATGANTGPSNILTGGFIIRGESGGVSLEELTLRERVSMRRNALQNIRARLWMKYSPESLIEYDGDTWFFLGGNFVAKQSRWDANILLLDYERDDATDSFESFVEEGGAPTGTTSIGSSSPGGGGGVSDHGDLSGLGDPSDHPWALQTDFSNVDDWTPADDRFFQIDNDLSEGNPVLMQDNLGLTDGSADLSFFTLSVTDAFSANSVRPDTGRFLAPVDYKFRNAGDTDFRDVEMAGLTATQAALGNITEDRVLLAGASGLIDDSAALTFDGTTLAAPTMDMDTLIVNGVNIFENGGEQPLGTGDNVEFQDINARDGLFTRDDTAIIEIVATDTAQGVIGTDTNHNLRLRANNNEVVTLFPDQSATFFGTLTGVDADFSSTLDVDGPATFNSDALADDAAFISERAWGEFFAAYSTDDSDLAPFLIRDSSGNLVGTIRLRSLDGAGGGFMSIEDTDSLDVETALNVSDLATFNDDVILANPGDETDNPVRADRELTINNDADSALTWDNTTQNLTADRSWTPTLADHGDGQRGVIAPSAQSIYGNKTFEADVILANEGDETDNPVRADRTLQMQSIAPLVFQDQSERDLTQDLSWNITLLRNEPLYVNSDNLDIRNADPTQRGVVTTGAQSFAGIKTFQDNTVHEDQLSTTNFVSGFAGSGWIIDPDFNGAYAEFDNLTVRERFRVYELLINQIRATNGSLWVSSSAKVESVADQGSGVWRLFMPEDQFVPFLANDLVRAQRFTGAGMYLVEGEVTNIENGENDVTDNSTARYFDVTLESGSDDPFEGIELVRIGNASDTDRQGAVYLTSDDAGAPFIDIIDEVDSFTAWNEADKTKARFGKLDGITWDGNPLDGYGAFTNRFYATDDFNVILGTSDIMRFGKDVGGAGLHGLFINADNYWYGTGDLSVGGTEGMQYDPDTDIISMGDNVEISWESVSNVPGGIVFENDSINRLTGLIADNIAPTSGREWAAEAGADVTDYTDSRVSNALSEGDVTTITRPEGATYSEGSGETGAIKITLPQSWTGTTMRFWVDVYNRANDTSFTIQVGGVNRISTSSWADTFATIAGDLSANNTVRFGHDGTNCCILIGDTDTDWNYLKVIVKDFQAGNNDFAIDTWDDSWNISLVTSLPSQIDRTISDALLDARSIQNQGDLAIQDDADWATQITGGGKPADNADVTGDNPQSSTWLTDAVDLIREDDNITRMAGRVLSNIQDDANFAKVNATSIQNGQILLSEGIGSLDDIDEGTTYGKVRQTAITSGNILLSEVEGDLDDLEDGDDFSRVASTAIDANGIVILSAVSGNLDDVSDGGTYGKVLGTQLSAGEIVLSQASGSVDWDGQVSGTGKPADNADVTSGQFASSLSDIDDATGRGLDGLDNAGNVKRILQGSNLTDGSPGSQDLYLTATHMGFWDGSDWNVYIENDGSFFFRDGNNDGISFQAGNAFAISAQEFTLDGGNGNLLLDSTEPFISVGGSNTTNTAGLTGGGGSSDPIVFWAGGLYEDRGSASAQIRSEGGGQLAGGDISWDSDGNAVFEGTVTVTGGNASTQDYADTQAANALASAEEYTDAEVYRFSANTFDESDPPTDYTVNGSQPEIAKMSVGGWSEGSGMTVLYRRSSSTSKQVLFHASSNAVWERYYDDSSWSSWRETEDVQGAQNKADSARNDARDTLAEKLGYDDYTDMYDLAADGNTLIQGGLVTLDILDAHGILADVGTFTDSLFIGSNQEHVLDGANNEVSLADGALIADETSLSIDTNDLFVEAGGSGFESADFYLNSTSHQLSLGTVFSADGDTNTVELSQFTANNDSLSTTINGTQVGLGLAPTGGADPVGLFVQHDNDNKILLGDLSGEFEFGVRVGGDFLVRLGSNQNRISIWEVTNTDLHATFSDIDVTVGEIGSGGNWHGFAAEEDTQNRIRIGEVGGEYEFQVRHEGDYIVRLGSRENFISGFSLTETEFQSTNNTGFETDGLYMDSDGERMSLGTAISFDDGAGVLRDLSIAGELSMDGTLGSIRLPEASNGTRGWIDRDGITLPSVSDQALNFAYAASAGVSDASIYTDDADMFIYGHGDFNTVRSITIEPNPSDFGYGLTNIGGMLTLYDKDEADVSGSGSLSGISRSRLHITASGGPTLDELNTEQPLRDGMFLFVTLARSGSNMFFDYTSTGNIATRNDDPQELLPGGALLFIYDADIGRWAMQQDRN